MEFLSVSGKDHQVMTMRLKKNIKVKVMQSVAGLCFVFAGDAMAFSEQQDWLAVQRVERKTHQAEVEKSQHLFVDDFIDTVVASRDLRMMLDGVEATNADSLQQSDDSLEMDAKSWLASLSTSKAYEKPTDKRQCVFNPALGSYECETIVERTEDQNIQPQVMVLAPLQKDDAVINSMASDAYIPPVPTLEDDVPHADAVKTTAHQTPKPRKIKFYRGNAGLVTTEGGKIVLSSPIEKAGIEFSADVKRGHVSMFVRDPSILLYDQQTNQLVAQNPGDTELFVVSKDRISIIPVTIAVSSQNHVAAQQPKTSSVTKNPQMDLSVPSSLASVDALDRVASQTRASYQAQNGTTAANAPDDFKVPNEMVTTDVTAATDVTFVRAKAKTSFTKMFVRFIDERSTWDLTQVYPAGGLRIKIIGTEFESRTDSQGYIEIPDLPAGARVFAEMRDDSGAMMPGFAEIVSDPSAQLKSKAQVVMVRRYLSLDYAARLAGVVQNMELSSICGVVVDTSSQKRPLTGVRLATETAGSGPFYFNNMGYLDTRIAATGSNGRFCFFNVQPGPISFGVAQSDGAVQAVVTMIARGRHTEEMIALEDARHLTTTIASVPTASEQLSTDLERGNRYLPVEQAEVVPVGGRDSMIPIDEGVYTSASPVVPMRGRVWTVANSSDFEVSVQAASIRLPGSRQITSLLPRGFIEDMAVLAQSYQEHEKGLVVVEHANISGQGSEAVKIRLLDTAGNDAGDGWYFADAPVAKALFFNVTAGAYTVLVETNEGHWLAADTLVVYPETATYVRTGAPLEKHLLNTSASQ